MARVAADPEAALAEPDGGGEAGGAGPGLEEQVPLAHLDVGHLGKGREVDLVADLGRPRVEDHADVRDLLSFLLGKRSAEWRIDNHAVGHGGNRATTEADGVLFHADDR